MKNLMYKLENNTGYIGFLFSLITTLTSFIKLPEQDDDLLYLFKIILKHLPTFPLIQFFET